MGSEPKNHAERNYMPKADAAERAILYAIFLDNSIIQTQCAILEPWEFSYDSHRTIFQTQREMIYEGNHCDELTLVNKLGPEKVDRLGGVSYITDNIPEGLIRTGKLATQVENYVAIVKEKARLRDMMRSADEFLDRLSSQEESSVDLSTRMISFLQNIANESETNDIEHIGTYLQRQGSPEEMFVQMEAKDGIPVGLADLDEILGGLQPEELIIIAARPSMGKTAFLATCLNAVSVRREKTAAAFVLEQKRRFIIRRMLAGSCRVNYNQLKKNDLSKRERDDLMDRRLRIMGAPLYVDDTPGLTASRIRAKCMRLKAQKGLDIIFIDQLSHVDGSDIYRSGMQMRDVVGKQTKAFKRLAQDLGVPVVVFNQLSREAGKRKDFIPTLADLKESGNIEEDADVVLFLHRPEYYDKGNADLKGKGQIIVAKNREGATDTIDCSFQGQYMLWEQEAPQAPANNYQRDFSSDQGFYESVPDYDDPRWK